MILPPEDGGAVDGVALIFPDGGGRACRAGQPREAAHISRQGWDCDVTGRLSASIALAGMLLLLASPAWASVGRIKTVAGAASIQRGSTAIPARPGTQIEPGDVLVTGKTGRLGVTFVDNTRFALLGDSKVEITEFIYDRSRVSGTFVASVARGRVGIVSGKIAKSGKDVMRVKTPTTLLGVRGTRFLVEVK